MRTLKSQFARENLAMVLQTRLPRRLVLAAPAITAASWASAQTNWPDRPIRLVVAFPAGSLTDVLARVLAEPFGRGLGQPVIIDNRPGGNGTVGTQSVAQTTPDGLTLLVISTSAASINPHIIRRLPFDPLRDFSPIGALAEAPYLFAVPGNSPDSDFPAFLERARRNPGVLNFSHGNASSLIMTEVLARQAGVRLTAVPYRGGAEALSDVVAGRIDCTFTDFANGLAQMQAGRVRALAQSAADFTPLAPEVPPVARTLPGYDINVWFGLAGPAGLPAPILARLNEALNIALREPALVARLGQLGFLPFTQTPQQFAAYLREQLGRWGEFVRIAGVEPQ